MKLIETSLPGVFELRPTIHRDAGRFLAETYHKGKFAELGITDAFAQDNHSGSTKGTLRSLHYQPIHTQAKLCCVVEGEAPDVVVDIRVGSPSFGQMDKRTSVCKRTNSDLYSDWILPRSLALTDIVEFLYKCSNLYDPKDEHGIAWNDPALEISWSVRTPLVSEKDESYPGLVQVLV